MGGVRHSGASHPLTLSLLPVVDRLSVDLVFPLSLSLSLHPHDEEFLNLVLHLYRDTHPGLS